MSFLLSRSMALRTLVVVFAVLVSAFAMLWSSPNAAAASSRTNLVIGLQNDMVNLNPFDRHRQCDLVGPSGCSAVERDRQWRDVRSREVRFSPRNFQDERIPGSVRAHPAHGARGQGRRLCSHFL